MFKLARYRTFRVAAVAASALAVGLGVAAGAPTGPASAATTPSPPFTECPAIGAAPSCEILLVVNGNGTVSVANDPSVGPFDGSDDTLVGIINDSQAAVKAVTVDGPGSGLAGFDGDGICSGDYGTWTGSADCPYGPTGYEGPGTSFVTGSNLDEAEVDFTGGLAPGATAYFSLEGALATATLTAREGGLSGLTITGSDLSTAGQAGKQDTGSPKQAKYCRSIPGQVKFVASEAVALEALGAFATAGLDTAANNLAQFLAGTGDEIDYPGTSEAASEVTASPEFKAENKAILAYVQQQVASGVTQIALPSGKAGVVHALGFTSKLKEPDLYLAFRYTHSITVSGSGTLSNGSYSGSLVYTIGESYGFNKGNRLLDAGPALRYLQTTCGAPDYPKGAHWFPVTVTVTVPFTVTAPAGAGG